MWNKKLKKGKKGNVRQESKEDVESAEVRMNNSTENNRRARRILGKILGKNTMSPNWRELNFWAYFIASVRHQFYSPQILSIFRKASEDGGSGEPINGQRAEPQLQQLKRITEYSPENSCW